jgi:hypothetical protein
MADHADEQTTTVKKKQSKSSQHQVDTKELLWKALFWTVAILLLIWSALQVTWVWRLLRPLYTGDVTQPLGVFSNLFVNDWSFSLTNSPPLVALQSLFVIIMTASLGALCLRIFDLYLTRRAFWCLAFLIGFGISGIAFELLIMIKGLYLITSWLLWVLLFGAAIIAFRFFNFRPIWRFWRKESYQTRPLYPFIDQSEKLDFSRIQWIGPRHDTRYEESLPAQLVGGGFLIIAAMLCGLTFWHAIFYPETYWDSLILYLGYARMTFIDHKFPIKITGQVGIGLGANYPHIFSNYGAMASTLFGSWHELYQRMLPPILQVISVVLIYDTIMMMLGRRVVALGAIVLFLSVPYGIAYYTYASNYSVALAYTASFLYLAAVLAKTRLPGAFVVLTFIPAVAMHINYLMGVLWIPWVIVCVFAFWKYKAKTGAIMRSAEETEEDPYDFSSDRMPVQEPQSEDDLDFQEDPEEVYSAEINSPDAPSPIGLLKTKIFWTTFII